MNISGDCSVFRGVAQNLGWCNGGCSGAQVVAQNSGECSMGAVGAQNDNTQKEEANMFIL